MSLWKNQGILLWSLRIYAYSWPLFRLQMFQSISSHIKKLFKHPQLIQLLEFPVLFLGATPEKTPAMYSLMNYADINLGTWYPMGGMHEIVKAMVSLCEELGVDIRLGHEVDRIVVEKGKAKEVQTRKGAFSADVVLGGADYHHVEQKLLDNPHRMYSASLLEKKNDGPFIPTLFIWDWKKRWISCCITISSLTKTSPSMLSTSMRSRVGPKNHFSTYVVLPKQIPLWHRKARKICLS
jgi:hypothetical protein